ncbi:DUF4345 family protein [Couchioplanes azureus]|uniref:DUF4345 family protein n=1 Tax=Couchioplanes caeruleus TaxID=56438 RepID=UPI0016706CBB|nr:DUF4345 family protein [Couchioplanes caeruleus]GGQ83022.1 membrane protein [Couchioplanes caeruleus subsp. azureus]
MSGAVILTAAALFLAMGGYGLIAPAALVRPFGIALPSAEARAEVRAVYGGFGVAVAGVLTIAGLDLGGIRAGAVSAVAVGLLGMAGGRLVARLAEAPRTFYPIWCYFWVETVASGLLLLAVWS